MKALFRDLWNAKYFLLPFTEQTAESQEFFSPQSPANHSFPSPGFSPLDPSTPQVHYQMTVGAPREVQFNLQPVSPQRLLFWSTFLGEHKCFRSDQLAFLVLPVASPSINASPCLRQQSLCKPILWSLAVSVTLPLLSWFHKPSLTQTTHVFGDHCPGQKDGHVQVHRQPLSITKQAQYPMHSKYSQINQVLYLWSWILILVQGFSGTKRTLCRVY